MLARPKIGTMIRTGRVASFAPGHATRIARCTNKVCGGFHAALTQKAAVKLQASPQCICRHNPIHRAMTAAGHSVLALRVRLLLSG